MDQAVKFQYICPYCKKGIMIIEIMHGGLECPQCGYYTRKDSDAQGESKPIKKTIK